jgi:hypothetical protein
VVNPNIPCRPSHQPLLELRILPGLWASVWTQVCQNGSYNSVNSDRIEQNICLPVNITRLKHTELILMFPLTHCGLTEAHRVKKYNFLVLTMITCVGCVESFSRVSTLDQVVTKINLLNWLRHCSISHGTPCHLSNPKVCHQEQQSAPLDSIVIHMNPFNFLTPYPFHSCFNIIPPFMPRSRKLPFPSGFPTNIMCEFLTYSTRAILKNVRKQINSIKLWNKITKI